MYLCKAKSEITKIQRNFYKFKMFKKRVFRPAIRYDRNRLMTLVLLGKI
jgi:hypothetical protein